MGKSATCCDGDGCVAATVKCCCSLFHAEIPPSNTPGCGCGPLMCGGNLDPERVMGFPHVSKKSLIYSAPLVGVCSSTASVSDATPPVVLMHAAWWRASSA